MHEIEPNLMEQAKAGDAEAVQAVLEKTEGLVRWWLKRLCWKGPWEDGMQEGRLGVLEAIRRFDPDKGAKFTTYAGFRIRLEVGRAMQNAPIPVEEIFEVAGREDEVPQAAQDAQVRRAMEAVGGKDADLLRWRFFYNESLGQIAKRLKCHKFTVSKRIDKALAKVKTALAAN